MTNALFFRSLNYDSAFDSVVAIFRHFPVQYAATIGLHGNPQVRPVSLCFAENGTLYFSAAKSSFFYAELCRDPRIQLCCYDDETGSSLRVSGKVCFTQEPAVLARCLSDDHAAGPQSDINAENVIAFFLTEMTAELRSPLEDVPDRDWALADPGGVLIGIRIKKDTELRDRLSKLLARREAQDTADRDSVSQKLLDGALFLFAEAAKKLWPRMDIRPIERAAVFETYDEREQYTALAAKLIGNASIDKPEDLTYWLNPETLAALYQNHEKQEAES